MNHWDLFLADLFVSTIGLRSIIEFSGVDGSEFSICSDFINGSRVNPQRTNNPIMEITFVLIIIVISSLPGSSHKERSTRHLFS